jgi:hypothetical protein
MPYRQAERSASGAASGTLGSGFTERLRGGRRLEAFVRPFLPVGLCPIHMCARLPHDSLHHPLLAPSRPHRPPLRP